MPTVTTLKSSRTREKKALVREKTEAETLLQTEWTDSQQEMLKLSLSTSKVLLSLETKLARLEIANDKLAEALEQEENTEALEQFQTTLDEESELIEDTIGKIAQLKIMKEEIEKRQVQGSRGLREPRLSTKSYTSAGANGSAAIRSTAD